MKLNCGCENNRVGFGEILTVHSTSLDALQGENANGEKLLQIVVCHSCGTAYKVTYEISISSVEPLALD